MIDPNTGMPALNPGWEWRISATACNEGFRVDLYREGDRSDAYNKDSAYVHSSVGFKPQHQVTQYDLQKVAYKILREREKRLQNEETGRQARERLVGIYPPKTLY